MSLPELQDECLVGEISAKGLPVIVLHRAAGDAQAVGVPLVGYDSKPANMFAGVNSRA